MFGEDNLPARLVNVNCTGDEISLIDCLSENQGTASCESAIAICQCMLLWYHKLKSITNSTSNYSTNYVGVYIHWVSDH